MAEPVFNNQGSTGNATAITGNGTFLPIQVPGNIPPARLVTGANQTAMFDAFSWMIVAGSTGANTVVTFQEVGPDGTARNLVNPPPITLVNSQTYNNSMLGPFHALQIVVSNITGNGIAYGELKATVRQGG